MSDVAHSGREDGGASGYGLTKVGTLAVDREASVLQHHHQVTSVQVTTQLRTLHHTSHPTSITELPRIVPPAKSDVVEDLTAHARAVVVHVDVR